MAEKVLDPSGSVDQPNLSKLSPEELRRYRLKEEADYYKTVEGFLDFVRDCGAAPDAQLRPHGVGAQQILNWKWRADPESPRGIYTFKVVLWPRGSFKSAVFDVGLVCWEIARNPNIRICVASETGKQARKFVKQAMKIIDSEWFRERFGVHRKDKDWKESGGEFTSGLRTSTHKKESTLLATGAGEVWTGSHWDLVIFDDVVSQENTKTVLGIETVNNWFGEMLAQLDPGCRLLIIGTLHHYADLYCTLMKDKEKRRFFEFTVHSWKNEDGTLFFPNRITHAFIELQKANLTSRMFACYYENKPTVDEQQIFKPEYFRTIPDDDIPAHVWTYLMTDFAFIAEEKKKGKADRTCFWVVSLDSNRVAYVRDFYVGRWKPSDSVRIACDLWDRYQQIGMRGIVVEETTHSELLQSIFEEIRRQTFVRPRIISISGRNQEIKDIRIEASEPRFRQGNIYFSSSLRENWKKWKPMFDEMTQWPFSEHDDIPDAISDLDKKDKNGKQMLPQPPVGWRMSLPTRHHPSLIDGQYNPQRGYPAREMLRQDNQSVGGDLWRQGRQLNNSRPLQDQGQTNDLWPKQSLADKLPGKS